MNNNGGGYTGFANAFSNPFNASRGSSSHHHSGTTSFNQNPFGMSGFGMTGYRFSQITSK